ncbi:response regulator transcription factor [Cytobacillus purgationiresistens]|uniref:Two-component system alkaline phosphatase synthesis response regulator PhoP n=1 Tax=Cytobacillus purgationiresistens TaxID=863449 RepID=A0ABU0ARP0_9BACI|nr:response regulator transcription factor [Cytobacillus purgationiresistens]MDQ0273944.1 two-component system alkaline phosphatase synthesis response regulator PhoP [Cytobacillus purgationiresistens]
MEKKNCQSILVVEDDTKVRNLIKIYLDRDGYEVIEADNGVVTKTIIEKSHPCMLILDLMIPGINGEKICRWIREDLKSNMPIIMLTAKAAEKDRINGFKLGADDYIVKPFSPEELMVRIKAVLRRTGSHCGTLRFHGLTLKIVAREAWIQNKKLDLTHFEFTILMTFMKHPGQVLSREQILNYIYKNNEKAVSNRTIDVHIKHLREKINTQTPKNYIQTVRGVGYKLVD